MNSRFSAADEERHALLDEQRHQHGAEVAADSPPVHRHAVLAADDHVGAAGSEHMPLSWRQVNDKGHIFQR